jgi:lysozyme family protein
MMAASNFAQCFALTLKHEGGYVDDPHDPGGATNLGVTIGTLSAYLGRQANKAEVHALTPEAVMPIYKANYWGKIRGDELPAGIDMAVYDFAVHSGPSRGAMALQRAIGVADDGVIGSITLANIATRPVDQIIERITADRMTFLRRLSTWPRYGKGWATRVNAVNKQALDMAHLASVPVGKVDVKPIPVIPAAPSAAKPSLLQRIAALITGKKAA